MGLKLYRRGEIWHIRGTVAGQRIRQSTGARERDQAEEVKAALEAQAWKCRIYGAETAVTFEEAAISYMEAGGERRFLPPLLKHFKGRSLHSIQPGDVRDAAMKIYSGSGPATMNRQAITPAKAIINHGHDRGWCGLIRVKRFAEPKTKKVAIDRDYIDTVAAAGNRYLGALMLFLFQSGTRIGEALRIEPDDLDLMNQTLTLQRTKNGEAREVALTREMVILLANLPPRSGRVFGYTDPTAVRNTLRRVCKRAGVAYLGTHQPGRHSFATTLSEEHGFSDKAIAEAGGWKSVHLVSKTYTHPTDPGRRAADALDGTNSTQRSRRDRA